MKHTNWASMSSRERVAFTAQSTRLLQDLLRAIKSSLTTYATKELQELLNQGEHARALVAMFDWLVEHDRTCSPAVVRQFEVVAERLRLSTSRDWAALAVVEDL